MAASELLTGLLRDVSRSFYLTLRVLPAAIRPQIGLAYLLARTTDTIADTTLVDLPKRLDALHDLRQRILGTHRNRLDFGELARSQGSPAERMLLERVEGALALLDNSQARDRQLIREVTQIITSGQELDLQRFADASAENIVGLRSEAELDDYTYRVAGCVGEFWTKMCHAHLFPNAHLDQTRLLSDGIRFGKGLQLINILRDLPADLRQGRCYLPADQLATLGLKPSDLLRTEAEQQVRPIYQCWLDRAAAHLAAGWTYTNSLPRRGCARVRLACAWPILIGVSTLSRLRDQNVLDASQRIKVSRKEVRSLMIRSVFAYPWPAAWQRLYVQAGGKTVTSVS